MAVIRGVDLEDVEWQGARVRRYRPTAATLPAALHRAARRFGERPALVDDATGTTSWAAFADLVEGAATHLVDDLGLRRGESLAVALPNGLDVAVAIYAAARAGLVFTGLPERLAPEAWAHQLQHSGSRVVLAAAEHEDGVRRAVDQLTAAGGPEVRVLSVGGHLTGRAAAWSGLAAHGSRWPDPREDDVYATVYTSGTTGRAKAVPLTHHGTVQAAEHYVRCWGLGPDDVTAVTFSFSYISGHVTQMTPAMLSGGAVVPVRDLAPRAVLALLQRHGVTWLDVVPALLGLLARLDGFAALPRLRLAVYGGAPAPSGLVPLLRSRVPHLRLCDAYGMSETAVAFCCLYDHEVERKAGTVGRPIPTADLRLVGEDGTDVAPGSPGELLVRGPFLFPGYAGAGGPEATAAAMLPEGWFRTGDVAVADDDGYVRLVDRVKDVVVRGGNKVFSAEVEAVVGRLPGVVEAAVVGLPDETGGESVAVALVLEDGTRVDPADVRRAVRTSVAGYAVPRRVVVVDDLPRGRTGKPDKRALRAQLLEGSAVGEQSG